MKKGIVISLLVVFGCWSQGFAAVNPAYEGGGAVTKWAEKGPPFVEGQVLLKMKPGFSPAAAAHAAAGRVRRSIGDGSIFLLEVGKGNVRAAVQALKRRTGVAIAEPNWIRRLHLGPVDPGYGYKWDLNNAGPVLPLKCVTNGWTGITRCPAAGADIDWEVVYDGDILSGASSVTIAVIDSGVDLNHPDLDSKLAPGWDFVGICDVLAPTFNPKPEDGECGDNNPSDPNGHGTHVAGIAAGLENGMFAVGVGYDSSIKVMPLRVCDEVGQCPDSALIEAINYAVANGAKVINLSLGGSEEDSPGALEPVIDAAWNAGLVVVASAGNDGGPISYPARFGNVIAVGSTNWGDGFTGYSNFGIKQHHVTAPGGEIEMGFWGLFPDDNPFAGVYSILPTYPTYISSILGGIWVHDEDWSVPYNYLGEGWLDGTSMAAPQVSGLAALLRSLDPSLSNGDVRTIIQSTADDLGDSGFDPYYGHGRINVYQAVYAETPVPDAPPDAPLELTATPGGGGKGKNPESPFVDLAWTDNSDNEGGFEIERCEVITSGKGKNKTETCNFDVSLNPFASVAANDITYKDTDVESGKNYRYRVRAVNSFGNSDWSNEADAKIGGGKGGGPKK